VAIFFTETVTTPICHFEEREIPASSSTKIGDFCAELLAGIASPVRYRSCPPPSERHKTR